MSRLSSSGLPGRSQCSSACARRQPRGGPGRGESCCPNTTKGFLAVASIDELRESWNKTQLGQLMEDPAMKPFVEDLQRQLQEKWTKTHRKLGITWEDLERVPSGEVAMAVILPSPTEAWPGRYGRRHRPQAAKTDALLDKIHQNLTAQKAVRRERNVQGTKRHRVRHSQARGRPGPADGLLRQGRPAGRLRQPEGDRRDPGPGGRDPDRQPGQRGGIRRDDRSAAATAAGELAPHVRWFVEPFGYADAMRLVKRQPRKKGTDMLKIFKEQGFTAIQGVGGFVNFSADEYEILHRTFVYAPGQQGRRRALHAGRPDARVAQRRATSRRPTGCPATWPPTRRSTSTRRTPSRTRRPWSTRSSATKCSRTCWNRSARTRTVRRSTFARDLIAYLGNRITIISDVQLPITPKSERMLFAVETTNEKQLADVIQSWMETDPDTQRREINGHVVWEIVDEKAELPMVTIENSPLGDDAADKDESRKRKRSRCCRTRP